MGVGMLTSGRLAKLRFSWAKAPIARARTQTSNTRVFFIVFFLLFFEFEFSGAQNTDMNDRSRTTHTVQECGEFAASGSRRQCTGSHLQVIVGSFELSD